MEEEIVALAHCCWELFPVCDIVKEVGDIVGWRLMTCLQCMFRCTRTMLEHWYWSRQFHQSSHLEASTMPSRRFGLEKRYRSKVSNWSNWFCGAIRGYLHQGLTSCCLWISSKEHDGLVICPDHNLSLRGSVDMCGMCHRTSISLRTFCYSLCQNLCQRVQIVTAPFSSCSFELYWQRYIWPRQCASKPNLDLLK